MALRGQYSVVVRNRRVQYKFTIRRSITILRGDSATGKTTLIDMIADHQKRGDETGITVMCERPCIVLTDANWQLILDATHNSIIFIDEGDAFVRTVDFADKAKASDNYFVIASRNPLATLPYSIQEIYGIRNTSGNRYQDTKRLYSEFYPLFTGEEAATDSIPDHVIVEDSQAGYTFWSGVCGRLGIETVPIRRKN